MYDFRMLSLAAKRGIFRDQTEIQIKKSSCQVRTTAFSKQVLKDQKIGSYLNRLS
jgi:hypothetical protein